MAWLPAALTGLGVLLSQTSETEVLGERVLGGRNQPRQVSREGEGNTDLSFLLALILAESKVRVGRSARGEVGSGARGGGAGWGGGGTEVSQCWGSGTTPETSL